MRARSCRNSGRGRQKQRVGSARQRWLADPFQQGAGVESVLGGIHTVARSPFRHLTERTRTRAVPIEPSMTIQASGDVRRHSATLRRRGNGRPSCASASRPVLRSGNWLKGGRRAKKGFLIQIIQGDHGGSVRLRQKKNPKRRMAARGMLAGFSRIKATDQVDQPPWLTSESASGWLRPRRRCRSGSGRPAPHRRRIPA
jgi:hypothetical protein